MAKLRNPSISGTRAPSLPLSPQEKLGEIRRLPPFSPNLNNNNFSHSSLICLIFSLFLIFFFFFFPFCRFFLLLVVVNRQMASEKKKYPIRAEDYELFEMVGQGGSAYVHRARCIPFDEIVAIKVLDFERKNSDLNNIFREAKTMILIDHPNVLNAHCSFVDDHNLWVVMPYMAGGSCLHIMKSTHANGFNEIIIATVLRDVLLGLEYLHKHGHIHRDVKAGNILVDSKGGIKLGDFGVSACLFDSGDRQRSRNTFVGTPCWMAPEVMEQLHGYDFKADIWSFGITALELAHGHAPFSKYPPMKVLLMTLQNAPPGLDYERDKKFSRHFKDMIAMCLVKDPSKRPTAQKLLKQAFFKQAKSQSYFTRKILEGLPTLGDRHQAIKEKEEDMLAQKQMPDGRMEEISQDEYKRGISGWNFDIEDLRSQASLISDNFEDVPGKDPGNCSNRLFELDTLQERMPDGIPYTTSCSSREDDDDLENDCKLSHLSSPDQSSCYQRTGSHGSDLEFKVAGSSDQNVLHNGLPIHANDKESYSSEHCEPEIDEKNGDAVLDHSSHERRFSTNSSFEIAPSTKLERYCSLRRQNQQQNTGHCDGDVTHTTAEAFAETKASKSAALSADDLDDKTKPPVIQQKGRFKVTSGSVDKDKALPPIVLQKSQSMQVICQSSNIQSSSETMSYGASLYQQLHCVLQNYILQQDNILAMMKQVTTGDISANRAAEGVSPQDPAILAERSLLEAASHEREKDLIQEVSELQWRLICKEEECQRLKAKLASQV